MNTYLRRGLVAVFVVIVVAIAAGRGIALTVSAATASVTSNIPSNPTVGSTWMVTVTGTPGMNVSAETTLPVPSTSGLGTIGSSGTAVFNGTFTSSNLTNGQATPWSETWLVGGTAVGTVNFTLEPSTAAPMIATTGGLPNAGINSPYSVNLQGTVGSGLTPMWSLTSGTTLPPGLSLSSGGTISGTATALGTYAFKVALSDGTQTANSPVLSITVANAPSVVTNPNIPTSVPSLDAIIQASTNLTNFINSAAFEGVYWKSTSQGSGVNSGGVSGDYATQATAQSLASAFGGTTVLEPAPPANSSFGYFYDPTTGTQNPSQWFVQFPDGTLMNAGQLAQDYFMGAATVQIKLSESITDTAKAFTLAPDGSPIVKWTADPSTDYSQWVGTDAKGFTWSTASNSSGGNCGLVTWSGPTIDTIPSNPDPAYSQTNGNTGVCTPGTSNINGGGATTATGTGSTTGGTTNTGGTIGTVPTTAGTTLTGSSLAAVQQEIVELLSQVATIEASCH